MNEMEADPKRPHGDPAAGAAEQPGGRRLLRLMIVLGASVLVLSGLIAVKCHVQRCVISSRPPADWLTVLDSGTPSERACAAEALASFTDGDDIYAHKLVYGLCAEGWDRVCIKAWQPAREALLGLGAKGIPALERGVDSGDPWVSKFSIRVLGELESTASGSLDMLRDRLARRTRGEWGQSGYHLLEELRLAISRIEG